MRNDYTKKITGSVTLVCYESEPQLTRMVSKHLDTVGDLFGGPDGSRRTDRMVAAAVQCEKSIMRKMDTVFSNAKEESTRR